MTTPGAIPTFKVSVVEQEPFIMRKLGSKGQDEYVGFIKDVIDTLAEKVGFNPEYQIAKGEEYGRLTPSGWTGAIGEVVRKEAEIAAGALTITMERGDAVDFTKPVMSTSVGLLVSKPHFMDFGLGYLVRPFSTEFWMMVLISILIMGFLFFLVGKFSPYEWIKVPDERDQRGARNAFSLRNSYLFVLSSVTWQGFREPPRSISGRFLAAFWWIFVLFTLIAYTANLTAYLLARPEQMPIMPFRTYDDLVKANDISVGVMEFGSTQSAMRKSRDSTLNELWNKIAQRKSWVGSYEEGLERVKRSEGGFVFFMETASAEYLARQNCDVMIYGDEIFPSSYGIATQKGSVLSNLIDKELLKMTESGELELLRKRWWKFSGDCTGIDGREFSQKGETLSSLPIYPITLRDMSVAILILFLGIIVAVVCLIGELIYHTIQTKGKIEKPKMLDAKIFKGKFKKGKSSKPAASSQDPEAGVSSEPLTEEALGEGTSGAEEVKEA